MITLISKDTFKLCMNSKESLQLYDKENLIAYEMDNQIIWTVAGLKRFYYKIACRRLVKFMKEMIEN